MKKGLVFNTAVLLTVVLYSTLVLSFAVQTQQKSEFGTIPEECNNVSYIKYEKLLIECWCGEKGKESYEYDYNAGDRIPDNFQPCSKQNQGRSDDTRIGFPSTGGSLPANCTVVHYQQSTTPQSNSGLSMISCKCWSSAGRVVYETYSLGVGQSFDTISYCASWQCPRPPLLLHGEFLQLMNGSLYVICAPGYRLQMNRPVPIIKCQKRLWTWDYDLRTLVCHPQNNQTAKSPPPPPPEVTAEPSLSKRMGISESMNPLEDRSSTLPRVKILVGTVMGLLALIATVGLFTWVRRTRRHNVCWARDLRRASEEPSLDQREEEQQRSIDKDLEAEPVYEDINYVTTSSSTLPESSTFDPPAPFLPPRHLQDQMLYNECYSGRSVGQTSKISRVESIPEDPAEL